MATLAISCSDEIAEALKSVEADIKAITQSTEVVFSNDLTDPAANK